jgi:hypothetical protein
MCRAPQARLTLPAVAGRLERGVRPHCATASGTHDLDAATALAKTRCWRTRSCGTPQVRGTRLKYPQSAVALCGQEQRALPDLGDRSAPKAELPQRSKSRRWSAKRPRPAQPPWALPSLAAVRTRDCRKCQRTRALRWQGRGGWPFAEVARNLGRSGSHLALWGRSRSAATCDGSEVLRGKMTGVGVWPNVRAERPATAGGVRLG